MSLNGQTAVILGGSGGIGMVICRDLLKEDVKVFGSSLITIQYNSIRINYCPFT